MQYRKFPGGKKRYSALGKYEIMTRYGIDGMTFVKWEYEGFSAFSAIPPIAPREYPVKLCDEWVRKKKPLVWQAYRLRKEQR